MTLEGYQNVSEPVRFIRCLPFILHEECVEPPGGWGNFVWSDIKHNFSDDAGDPGGKTMCGIIQREYDHYRKSHGLATRPVSLISESEGRWIYYHWYWEPHCGSLPSGLDLSFFDSAVNEGSTEATRILQVSLSLVNDGQWGPRTSAAVAAITPSTVAGVNVRFAKRRQEVYQETQGFKRFGKDWTSRTARILNESIGMLDAIA